VASTWPGIPPELHRRAAAERLRADRVHVQLAAATDQSDQARHAPALDVTRHRLVHAPQPRGGERLAGHRRLLLESRLPEPPAGRENTPVGKTIRIGLGILIAAVIGFCALAALQPSELHVERSALIAAPPAVVFAQVNDLRKWQEFSPWAKRDPAAKTVFEGPAAGTGASFTWDGNAEVGAGRMTIVESRPNELVRFRLDFLKPFEGTNDVAFTLTPQDAQTRVVWSMDGENDFVGKAIGLVVNMDAMIGGDFEQGLADLKRLSEAAAGV
jgi:hypothetical protein